MGVAKSPPCLPNEVMVKEEPPRSSRLSLPSLASVSQPFDLLGNLQNAQPIRIPKHGNRQTSIGRCSNADIVVALDDHFATGIIDEAIKSRMALETGNDSLHDERQK